MIGGTTSAITGVVPGPPPEAHDRRLTQG